MTLESYEELDEFESRLRRNLESNVADFLEIFQTDVATFVEKQVRNRFIGSPDFAEALDDDKILKLKNRIKEVGENIAKEVCEGLSGDMDFWFGPDVPLGEGKSMEAHTPLIERLQVAAVAASELLAEFKFPENDGGGYDIKYAPPAYFVNGKYAPGLAETFWRNLAQLDEVRRAREEQDVGRRRSVQRHRWDAVSKKKKKS